MKGMRLFLGMVAANVTGAALCGLAILLVNITNSPQPIIYPSLALIPFAMGLVAALVWKPLALGKGATAGNTLLSTLLGLLGAWLVFREGIVCLLIVSPIFYIFTFVGALMGRTWFRVDRTKLNASLLPLLLLLTVGEPLVRVDKSAVATDEILIHAPPEKVWPHVTSFPEIAAPPHFWLFRLGLPMPMATTSAGDFAGADRRCIFSGGAVFVEKVAEIVPDEKLTFDIVESPKDPELIGHLTPQRGQFELRDNHDGTTTLIGRTWYTLHVRPLWYFDWWTRVIFRAVHLRVMENVREMSERGT